MDTPRNVTKSFFDRTVWLPIVLAGMVLSAALLLPYPYRDIMLLAAAGAATVFAFLNFETAWIVFIALVPLVRLSGGVFQNNAITVSRIIVVLWLFVLWYKYKDSGTAWLVFKSKGFIFFGLFVVANLLAAVRVGQLGTLLTALTYLEPLLFFTLSYALVRLNRNNAPRLLQAFLIGGFLVALVGLFEMATQRSVAAILNPSLGEMQEGFLRGWESNRFGLGGRISSLIVVPPYTSLYFVLVLIVAIYYVHAHERSRRSIAVFTLFGGVCVLLILATGTRAGLLALLTALLVLSILGPKRTRYRLLMLGGIAGFGVLLFIIVPTLHEYVVSSLDFANDSIASRNITGRWALTMELLRIFREHWFLGYGPGLVQKQAVSGELPTVPGIKSLGGIENQYATILADGGIVAGTAYLLFMLGVFWEAIAMMRRVRWHAMGLTLLALFAAYFVFVATETTINAVPNVLLMAVYGAFAAEYQGAPAAEKI